MRDLARVLLAKRFILILLIASNASLASFAQTILDRDPVIEQAVKEVSVPEMHKLIEDLVSFHNRNNLSSMNEKEKGIGASAEYLYNKVASFIPFSQGR